MLAQAKNVEKPNILLILADDLGYADTGFTGAKDIKTPNLDQLAKAGVVMNNGYVTHPYCGPSRAGLLVGRHQARFGAESNNTYSPFDNYMGLPVSEKTFAKRLQEVGYRTGIVGKWHLGAAPPFHPNNRGFDHFYGFLSGGRAYFPEGTSNKVPLENSKGQNDYMANEGGYLPLVRNGGAGELTEYLTTALSRDAARFVTESKDPFFLFLSYNAPHAPLEAPEETIKKYQAIEDPERRIYAAMIDEMDAGIGMVVDALKASGKYDNTLIFFLSDNGGVYPEYWMPDSDWADNTPFRRGKVSLLEGGVHVPFFLHWPQKLKPGEFDGLVSALDIAATALALGNAPVQEKALDGVNLIPYLTGERQGSPHKALFWHLEEGDGNTWAVRTEDAKYMHQTLPGVGRSYFDMREDPYEQNNLVDQFPERQSELAELWNQWNAGNQQNVLMQAYEYQKARQDFYKSLYEERVKQAKERKPIVVQ
ncbi:sulfatase family protein [Microbulbifer elongatus]|nr:sulfatase-like hydrolase/transferase [Microbulbifer elongatus]